MVAEISSDVEARHLRLHSRVLACFFAGAVGGPALYLAVGHWSMLIPVGLLCGLAAFDIRLGLGSRLTHQHAAHASAPVGRG
jgi:uncharacterized membrane protein YoaK (UPF0700 family)